MAIKHKNANDLIKSMQHPQEDIIQLLRNIIKQTSNELSEGVKWNSPSYSLDGNDIITFNFHYNGYVSLVFHTGPKGKDTHTNKPLFKDETQLLEWVADKRAIVKISTIDQLEAIKSDIEKIIHIWINKGKSSFQEE